MLRKMALLTIFLTSFTAYADVDAPLTDNINKGVDTYNWQTCLDKAMSTCVTNCQISEDPDCKSDCNQTASDKCKSMGLSPSAPNPSNQ